MRWQRGRRDLIGPLSRLYPQAFESGLMDRLHALLERHWGERPADLRHLDMERDLNPDWFLSEDMVAYVFYIDRFAGQVRDVAGHIPYLADLGVTYAHLMPCLKPRPGQSDGGYAVMDYTEINPVLGSMADFQRLALQFRSAGISPCIDLVLNHTAKEHDWAVKARAGDPFYRAFYRIYDDPHTPEAFERTLTEVFPDQAPGNFTHYEDVGWVWTTFNEYQWDLNWENPEVFLSVLDIILFLANKGVEVFRLDAVAFMWKRMGTVCQNLPEVHDILQALVQASRVTAPAIIHKAEAIVAPGDLVPYLGQGRHTGREAQLAYHNSLMVQYWSALASRDTRLMTYVLSHHFPQSFRRASFATYIRCHDDIGWAITEEDAEAVGGITGPGHRRFLADYYAGRFPTSFARGADFQVNEETGDKRTNGSFASLAGLEDAVARDDAEAIDLAIERILMGHALIASFGGMPLIYMGDELGLTNDHSYMEDPALAEDGRWMQRPYMDWTRTAALDDGSPAARIHAGTRDILHRRKATPQLASDVPTEVIDVRHPGLFAFRRHADEGLLTGLFNFTESWQSIRVGAAQIDPSTEHLDLLTGEPLSLRGGQINLPPYGRIWAVRNG
ncbi:alpha-amylase family protein [Roseisalinus antarcticus]|nr:alpha-amylase family protein [Roseisalinus antarcticus]